MFMLQYDLDKQRLEELKLKSPESDDAIRSFLVTLRKLSGGKTYELSEEFEDYWVLNTVLYGGVTPNRQKFLIKQLFRNFREKALYGRAREKGKYALLLDLTDINEGIILIQTLKIGDEYKPHKVNPNSNVVILKKETPFLQATNIYRFVQFFRVKDKVKIRFFERSYSQKFREWLHIEEDLLLKHVEELTVSFLCKLGKIPIKLSLPEEAFYNQKILRDYGISLDAQRNMIIIKTSTRENSGKRIRLQVKRIWLNITKQEFDNLNDLLKHLKLRKHGFDYLRAVYNTIKEKDFKGNPTNQAVFDPLYIERFREIVPASDQMKVSFPYPVNKYRFISEEFKDKIIIVSDFEGIRYDKHFLSTIFLEALAEDNPIDLVHALLPISSEEERIEIGPIKLYNKIEIPQITKALVNYYQQEENIGDLLYEILKLSIVHSLKVIPEFKHFVKSLFNLENFEMINYKVGGHAIRVENEFLEYKEPTILYNPSKWDKTVKKWTRDIIGKLYGNDLTVTMYVIGVEENGRDVVLVNRGKFDDNQANKFFKKLEATLNKENIEMDYITIPAEGYFIGSNRHKTKGEGHIFAFYAYKS